MASLLDLDLVAKRLTAEAPWREGHGADASYLGMGLLYYALVYTFRARVAVCLGSGGGFVPRLMRQAQRDVGMADRARTILVDANRPEVGWGAPAWLPEGSLFRSEFGDVELVITTTRVAAETLFEPQGLTIDYLHIDADHTFEACLEDFTVYRRCLRPGSLVTLHDTRLAGAGVRSVVDHIRSLSDCEVIDFPDVGVGTALVRVREDRPALQSLGYVAGPSVAARRRADAPLLPPPSTGLPYLDSEAFSTRSVIAAHFLRRCRSVVQIGAPATSIESFLGAGHQSVVVVDPHGRDELSHSPHEP